MVAFHVQRKVVVTTTALHPCESSLHTALAALSSIPVRDGRRLPVPPGEAGYPSDLCTSSSSLLIELV